MYKLNKDWQGNECGVTRLSDNTTIPFVADNSDYQAYLKWLEEGNQPQPADEVNQ